MSLLILVGVQLRGIVYYTRRLLPSFIHSSFFSLSLFHSFIHSFIQMASFDRDMYCVWYASYARNVHTIIMHKAVISHSYFRANAITDEQFRRQFLFLRKYHASAAATGRHGDGFLASVLIYRLGPM